ncbi:MAG: hypothetical protein K2X87_16230 [Gemmataceae bacterium]|nr:hypothetical protein [Gemmataceae bacterium]
MFDGVVQMFLDADGYHRRMRTSAVRRYSPDEAARRVREPGHPGPWDDAPDLLALRLAGGPCDGQVVHGTGGEAEVRMAGLALLMAELERRTEGEAARWRAAPPDRPPTPQDVADRVARLGEVAAGTLADFPTGDRVAVYRRRPGEPTVYDFAGYEAGQLPDTAGSG